MSDGVYVTFDKWHSKASHDKYLFMEQITIDRELDKVLIISDKRYANNANSQFSGVGGDTQILSSAAYRSLDVSKFIPIVTEFNNDGEPYLPAYLQTRIYLSFLNDDDNETAYEQLLRNIYNSPRYKIPVIGSSPTF